MASQAEIQAGIDEIVTGAQYPAIKMRPLLTSMLDFSSAGQTLVYPDLVANNTTMEDTTLVLNYGVNIIGTATLTDYACRLPIPTTGKRISVVNNSLLTISLFPDYNLGPDGYLIGSINNGQPGVPALIPADGKVYDFICVENPLPGAWVWSPPAIGQWNSGELSATTTTASLSNNIYSNSIVSAERTSGIGASIFDGLNKPPYFSPTPTALPNIGFLPLFKPTTLWNAITKIKVYTNISSNGISGSLIAGLAGGQGYNDYQAGTTTFVGSGVGVATNPYVTFTFNNVIAGVVPSPGVTANIGDAGTFWGEYTISLGTLSPYLLGTSVGDQFISTDGTTDTWLTTMLTLSITPRVIGNVKFQFFIEYM